jgi:hypothetical protein
MAGKNGMWKGYGAFSARIGCGKVEALDCGDGSADVLAAPQRSYWRTGERLLGRYTTPAQGNTAAMIALALLRGYEIKGLYKAGAPGANRNAGGGLGCDRA